ncbi:uncharacterized protein J3D65DRAFT_193542 [Phyllosticta citribraziliensis]|uniref:Uncharacterized protein n=1 Tax=Phyllosticta citribraziliensis TaxID=989973 RepID=A0ABR1M615_9PEZI
MCSTPVGHCYHGSTALFYFAANKSATQHVNGSVLSPVFTRASHIISPPASAQAARTLRLVDESLRHPSATAGTSSPRPRVIGQPTARILVQQSHSHANALPLGRSQPREPKTTLRRGRPAPSGNPDPSRCKKQQPAQRPLRERRTVQQLCSLSSFATSTRSRVAESICFAKLILCHCLSAAGGRWRLPRSPWSRFVGARNRLKNTLSRLTKTCLGRLPQLCRLRNRGIAE